MAQARQSTENTGRHAVLVAAGILASRLIGLVRQRVFSHFFGLSDTADAFSSALRVPNILQQSPDLLIFSGGINDGTTGLQTAAGGVFVLTLPTEGTIDAAI